MALIVQCSSLETVPRASQLTIVHVEISVQVGPTLIYVARIKLDTLGAPDASKLYAATVAVDGRVLRLESAPAVAVLEGDSAVGQSHGCETGEGEDGGEDLHIEYGVESHWLVLKNV